MSKFEDTKYCDNCNKETNHEIYSSDHERDSSGDTETCLVCGYYKTGYSDELYKPVTTSELDGALIELSNKATDMYNKSYYCTDENDCRCARVEGGVKPECINSANTFD